MDQPLNFERFFCAHKERTTIMAVILQMTYQKKLGLPNFSSHSCSVSVTTEFPDVSVVAQESTKLYSLLQTAVDLEIQAVGYMPDATTYGMKNGNGPEDNRSTQRSDDRWACTEGQRGFILRIVNESKLDKNDVENIAQQLFGVGVKQLDKMQASQLTEELLEKTGRKSKGRRPQWRNREQARA